MDNKLIYIFVIMYKFLSILSKILLIFNAISGMLIIACIIMGFYIFIPFIILAAILIFMFYLKYDDDNFIKNEKRKEILNKLGIK